MPQIYSQVFCYNDGALFAENIEIEVAMEGDDQDVMTIPKGWGGITPAPKKMKVTLKEAVPPTGPEFDAFKAFLNSEIHEFKAQLTTGAQMISKGFYRMPKLGGGVGKSMNLDVEFHGEAALFQ